MTEQPSLRLHLRTQELTRDQHGYTCWQVQEQTRSLPANQIAIIICDMWDRHWSRGATERVEELAPRMNQVVAAARSHGIQIIHAPSDTIDVYANTPARLRVLAAPLVEPPHLIDHPDPPQPIDASDEGSDTGETNTYRAWSRQHPVIEIDQQRDGISDNGSEIYRFLRQHSIVQVVLMGVHTNMCILNRSFAIKALVRQNMPVALVRDLTDAMYNPARPPYVSHAEGTGLVIAYIEKFWCPTISSADLITRPDEN